MGERIFDYERYIQKCLKEIPDLEERREAKMIFGQGLKEVFVRSENRYRKLEEDIYQSMEIRDGTYIIGTTIGKRSSTQNADGIWFPMIEKDIGGGSGMITIYLAADDEKCNQFESKKTICGRRKADGEMIEFQIGKCRKYIEEADKLQKLYAENNIPWKPVHTGYLERFYDLSCLEKDKVSVEEIEFEDSEFKKYILTGIIPLWNINRKSISSYEYRIASDKEVLYEHAIHIPQDHKDMGYLIEKNSGIINILHEKQGVTVTSKKTSLENIVVWCIKKAEKAEGIHGYQIFTNHTQDSFADRYLNQTGRFLQTRAELVRRIQSLTLELPVSLSEYEITGEIGGKRKLVLTFRCEDEKDYMCDAHIRYIQERVQGMYGEYRCVGRRET